MIPVQLPTIAQLQEELERYDVIFSPLLLEHLIKVQKAILNKLSWVEFDKDKLLTIIIKFQDLTVLNSDNQSYLFSNIITIYYTLRSKYSNKISDQAIIEMIHDNIKNKIYVYHLHFIVNGLKTKNQAQYSCYGLKPRQKLLKILDDLNEQIQAKGGKFRDDIPYYL